MCVEGTGNLKEYGRFPKVDFKDTDRKESRGFLKDKFWQTNFR